MYILLIKHFPGTEHIAYGNDINIQLKHNKRHASYLIGEKVRSSTLLLGKNVS